MLIFSGYYDLKFIQVKGHKHEKTTLFDCWRIKRCFLR